MNECCLGRYRLNKCDIGDGNADEVDAIIVFDLRGCP